MQIILLKLQGFGFFLYNSKTRAGMFKRSYIGTDYQDWVLFYAYCPLEGENFWAKENSKNTIAASSIKWYMKLYLCHRWKGWNMCYMISSLHLLQYFFFEVASVVSLLLRCMTMSMSFVKLIGIYFLFISKLFFFLHFKTRIFILCFSEWIKII